MENAWHVRVVKLLTGETKKHKTHQNICQGNSDRIITLYLWVKKLQSGNCLPLQDCINDFVLDQDWKVRVEEL